MKKLFAFSKNRALRRAAQGGQALIWLLEIGGGGGAFRKAKKRKKKAFLGGRGSEAFFSAWRVAASNDKGHADHACFRFKMLKKA